MRYINAIKIAIVFFPFVAALISLPFLIYHYRKYGSISFYRFLLIFSFFFYLLCIYFLVILPLPSRSSVLLYTTPYYNLKPFYFIPDFLGSSAFNVSDFSTYLLIFKKFKYLEAIFNILMVIPFGFYLRYYFRCGFFKTVFFSFCLSLFLELTQLSGLYFIYSRPYRLFDINDLINNTCGGFIGYLITPLFAFFLPSRDALDSSDYLRGRFVSVLRNGIALVIDYFIILFISFIFGYFIRVKYFKILYLFINFFVFSIVPCITSGYTFGKWILNIRNVGKSDDGSISFFRYFFKWIILHLFILNGWVILLVLKNNGFLFPIYVWYVYFGIFLFFIVYCFNCLIVSKDIIINNLLGISSVSVIGVDSFYDEI